MKHPSRDERDGAGVSPEVLNEEQHFAMYSVFATAGPIVGGDELAPELLNALDEAGVELRGCYDVAGFRAEADLMVWTLADEPEVLQRGYHAVRQSQLGASLEPVWSVVAVHRPSEFNRSHVPSCFSGFAPRPWLCVYPFVRSYDWYYLPQEDRARMLREHGIAGREYPEVVASTLASFGLGDYEWILAFESDDLTKIVDAMRHARSVEARLHVREETPFFTGQRVELSDWVSRQRRA